MTEDEARGKWCPFARVAVTVEDNQRRDWIGVVGANRGALHPKMSVPDVEDRLNPPSAHCTGSTCMAWRGRTSADFTSRANAAFRRDGARLTPTGEDLEGFCGLAGAPP